MHLIRLAVVACCVSLVGCANAIVRPAVSPSKPAADALLVLPGFGYSRAGERAFRSLEPSLAAEGIDLYLPTYVARSGLEQSRERLHRFFRENRLDRYERVHIFAFLAGGFRCASLRRCSFTSRGTSMCRSGCGSSREGWVSGSES